MPILPRLTSREPLDSAAAEGLLNGRGATADAPAGQQALARVLAIASGPASDGELAGQAAAMAAFAAATPSARRQRTAIRERRSPAWKLATKIAASGRRMRNSPERRGGLRRCAAAAAAGTGPCDVRGARAAPHCPAAPRRGRVAAPARPPCGRRRRPAWPPGSQPAWRAWPAGGQPLEAAAERQVPPEGAPGQSAQSPGQPGEPRHPTASSAQRGQHRPGAAAPSMTTPGPPGQVPVFTDPSGRRRRRMRRVGVGLTAVFITCMAVAAVGMLGGPQAPFIPWAVHPGDVGARRPGPTGR